MEGGTHFLRTIRFPPRTLQPLRSLLLDARIALYVMHQLINAWKTPYGSPHRSSHHIARTHLEQILDLATKNNERSIVDQRGEPAVVIISVQDFTRIAAPPPDWRQKTWSGAKRRGLDSLTRTDIDAEVAAHRRKKNPSLPVGRSDP
jgi:hypothetical protein